MTKLHEASLLLRDRSIAALLRWRRVFIVALHLVIIALSNFLAFALRFDGAIPQPQVRIWADWLLLLVLIRVAVFIPFRLYQGLWRYVSIYDARNIVLAVASSSILFFATVRGLLGFTAYPRSIYVLDAIILVCMLGGLRLGRRVYRELGNGRAGKTVLVYGAGDAGEMIVRDMRNNPFYGYQPVGFVDDDQAKRGTCIHGVRVLGGRDRLPEIMERARPEEVLIAMPRADARTLGGIVRALEPFKVHITTLPNLSALLDGKVAVSQIRQMSVEDLLPREPIDLDKAPVERLIRGRRVLVTGAGGSIGSELCRQILHLEPAELVLLERFENGLFAVAGELARRNPGARLAPVIADVADPNRVRQVLAAHRPDLVFHAAAHKHVPMMELNPCEAVKNNVLGTRSLARAAHQAGVPRFVMISTDKAVNPTSVMGATKRAAEFVVQEMNHRSATAFITVRFGNVLGSNGSVVPTFLEQIRRGGPVTVTHPEMRRYFMLIPEAVALVLHAAALGEGGEVFVLQMGEQVKLVDMARNLIRLAGHVPEEDIEITFTGVRPGEKLYEELVGVDEVAEDSGMPKITRVRPKAAPRDLERRVSELGLAAARGDEAAVIEGLRGIVPTFTPQGAGGREAGVQVPSVSGSRSQFESLSQSWRAGAPSAAALVGEGGMAVVAGAVPQTAPVQFVSRAELAPPKGKAGSHRSHGQSPGVPPAPPGASTPSSPSVVHSGAQAAPQK